MILLIDNYDSFVHNLSRYFRRLGCETKVVRNDAIGIADVRALTPSAIVLSPGPCTPETAGIALELVRTFTGELPILGVCLGHQTIVAAHGGQVVRSPRPMHGQLSRIEHNGLGVFEQIPSPCDVGRYHSLHTPEDSLPDCLAVTARGDGIVMAVAHRKHPVVGLQFHPESILTPPGYRILANFLRMSGIRPSHDPQELWCSECPAVPKLDGSEWWRT